MRSPHFLFVLLAIVAFPVSAQTDAGKPVVPDNRPPTLQPVEEGIEPQVTIRQREGEMVEEYRVNGRLYKVKVFPSRGAPYILIDHRGDGSFVREEGPGTPGLSVPQWVIGTF